MTSTAPPSSESPSTATERRALGIFAIAAVAGIAWIAQPVFMGLLLGALTAFALQPLYDRLRRRVGRSSLAAGVCVLVAAAGFGGTLAGIFYVVAARGTVIARSLITALGPDGEARGLLARVLHPLHVQPDELAAKLRDAAADFASRAATIAATVASFTFSTMLVLFFLMMTVFFTLERWAEIARHVESMLPLRPRYTHALLEEFRRVGRTTLLGTVATGLAQGALAGIGYAVTGVPEPAFFGAMTAIASLLPAVGTTLVWLPIGAILIATGHAGMGALELVWGALVVVGISDYVIRPRLVVGHGSMPALLTFTALFGGVEAFGLVGLVLGPIVMSLSFALLKIYAHNAEAQRPAEAPPA